MIKTTTITINIDKLIEEPNIIDVTTSLTDKEIAERVTELFKTVTNTNGI